MSTSDFTTNGEQVTALRQLLKSLNVQREALEHESEAITSELISRNPEQPNVPPMGIDTPLVDTEGYPRNDIDIFRARALRSRLMMIRTDHKNMMDEINTSLQQLAVLQQTPEYKAQLAREEQLRQNEKPKPKFDPISGKWVVRNWDGTIAGIPTSSNDDDQPPRSFDDLELVQPNELKPSAGNDSTAITGTTTDKEVREQENTNDVMDVVASSKPAPMIFRAAVSLADCRNISNNDTNLPLARVESVDENSPASLAGLKVNDHIIAFGPVAHQFDTASISTMVQTAAANGEVIEIICQRNDDSNGETCFVLLQLSPKPWPGRGLLGCHIVPC